MIESVRRIAGRGNRAVVRGIGDDCAILRLSPGHQLLVTTDLCIENVHFRREWHPPQSVGHRCLARGLSDIAAMGGEALACFLSLGLPETLQQRWVDQFLKALERLGRRFGVSLAGGDISTAKEIVADIILVGQVPSGKALLRSGAKPGDRIYVTGELGSSGAVLRELYAGKRLRALSSNRNFYPEPRLRAGAWLRKHAVATSMIDLSDGLSVDLFHICEESHVSAIIESAAIPVSNGADLQLATDSGDDYELLFTASPRTRVPGQIAGVTVSEIGVIQRALPTPGVTIRGTNGKTRALKPLGWQHFAKKK